MPIAAAFICRDSSSLILRQLPRWGWVASDRRQNEDGHRFWYNAYWKTEPAEAKAAYDPP